MAKKPKSQNAPFKMRAPKNVQRVRASKTPLSREQDHLIWDLPLRLFHWALMLCVIGGIISGKVERLDIHERFGLAILGLLCFRLLWGFIGSQTARFSNFLCAPKSVLHNLRDLAQGRSSVQAGHAPIGGYATMAILGVCLFMALSGSFSTDDILYEGPFAHMLPAYNKLAGTLHHFGEKLIFFIIFVHIAALIYYVVRVKKNLIPAMVHGRRKGVTGPDGRLSRRRLYFGFILMCAFIALFQAAPLLRSSF